LGECKDLGAEEGGFEIDYCWGIGRHFVWVVDFEFGKLMLILMMVSWREGDAMKLGDASKQHVTDLRYS
jgi:hypothetical protein